MFDWLIIAFFCDLIISNCDRQFSFPICLNVWFYFPVAFNHDSGEIFTFHPVFVTFLKYHRVLDSHLFFCHNELHFQSNGWWMIHAITLAHFSHILNCNITWTVYSVAEDLFWGFILPICTVLNWGSTTLFFHCPRYITFTFFFCIFTQADHLPPFWWVSFVEEFILFVFFPHEIMNKDNIWIELVVCFFCNNHLIFSVCRYWCGHTANANTALECIQNIKNRHMFTLAKR